MLDFVFIWLLYLKGDLMWLKHFKEHRDKTNQQVFKQWAMR